MLTSAALCSEHTHATAAASTQPAVDLITRRFGPEAAASFDLQIRPAADCGVHKPPCFAVSQAAARGPVTVVASGMSELTYGVGYYSRFSCGLTVGWKHGGGSHTTPRPGTAAAAWPCHGPVKLEPMGGWACTCGITVLHPLLDSWAHARAPS